MAIHIHDSARGELVPFQPLVSGVVSMYVCGPTVQGVPHVGHLRSALVYDLWRRWFEFSGFKVTIVRNVTDIDDKILEKAASETESGNSITWREVAYKYEREFDRAYDSLGLQAVNLAPRATESISEMIVLIAKLIERGHAYQATDGSADVYFDTASFPEYGQLTRQKLADMADAEDADPRGKKDPRDFTLWKSHKASEPADAAWDSPWGRGRPGWHIECSAMSTRFLGEQFDIHGGGLDLRFPHHENELAQSTAAGYPFANYWMHNGLVNVASQKMSKSLNNFVLATDFLNKSDRLVLRYFLSSAHYRSVLELSDALVAESASAFSRVTGFLLRASRKLGLTQLPEPGSFNDLPESFIAAMNDDLSVPEAIAVIHETVRLGNTALDSGDTETVSSNLKFVITMLEVLGLNPANEKSEGQAESALDHLVKQLISERNQARASKDFARSDEIRSQLADAGIALEDSGTETTWSFK
ncbi:MAG: cysteine--tRNA ligase [Microbacteriaceae bacterium]|nr:cysteine--tRNA ligase [Microbacteriaceae bacterium]